MGDRRAGRGRGIEVEDKGRRGWRALPWMPASLLCCALCPGLAHADVLHDVQCVSEAGKTSEIAFTVTGWIEASDVDALARCIPRQERPLPKRRSAASSFAGVRWLPKHLPGLASCNLERCVYNFPKWGIERVMAATTLEEKKRAYYEVVHQLSWGTKKKQKRDRIEPYEVQSELCANDGQFHWLLNGDPRRWDRVIWRKIIGVNRMRPTMMTMQFAHWKKGTHRCVGGTLLFADHYLRDGLELLRLTPLGGGKVAFNLLVRDRYDIFRGWWARRFRGTIRKLVRERRIKILRDRVRRCLRFDGQRQAAAR